MLHCLKQFSLCPWAKEVGKHLVEWVELLSVSGPGVENLSASILKVNLVHENKFVKYWCRYVMDCKG